MDLIADIGATRSRCALVDDKGRVLASEIFRNGDFTGVDGLLRIYLDHRRESDQPRRAALAVAAPILSDQVQMVNIDWQFSQFEIVGFCLDKNGEINTLKNWTAHSSRSCRTLGAAKHSRFPYCSTIPSKPGRATDWRVSAFCC